jgi:guanylate kinase
VIPTTIKPQPRLYVIAAPSGAGKTSLVKALLAKQPRLRVSVSHTTRPRRPTEVDGREYHFVSTEQFQTLVAQDAFLEHAEVFGNYYGTGREAVSAELTKGHDVILEIDWQGARQVRSSMPECRSIFVLPPSRAALEIRLRSRRTDSPEVIARRLRDAASDLSHWSEFDYAIVNDQFVTAVDELSTIVTGRGEHLRLPRAALAPLIKDLLA